MTTDAQIFDLIKDLMELQQLQAFPNHLLENLLLNLEQIKPPFVLENL